MNFLRKITKAAIYPPLFIVAIFVPMAFLLLIFSVLNFEETHPVAIVAYVLSFYALTVLSFRVPAIIAFFKRLKNENPYILRYRSDVRLRVRMSLDMSLLFNVAYAAFQLTLGVYHKTVWYIALAVYYILLSAIRFLLLRHTRSFAPGENPEAELRRARVAGIYLLLINLALSAIVLYIVGNSRVFLHHPITTIAMAAYSFTSLTVAIVGIVRYRKYRSPVFSASKAVSLSSALVSLITLENALIAAFAEGDFLPFSRLMTALTGGGITLVVISMAIYLIITSTQKLQNGVSDTPEESTQEKV